MSRQIIVTIPIPPRATQANAGKHWAPKARATKQQRQDAGFSALEAMRRWGIKHPFAKALVFPKFFFRVKSRHDTSNLGTWLKASLDGLADAKVVTNDRDITLLPSVVFVDPLYERVDLLVTEVDN